MTTLREAAQQALEALEELNGWQSLAPPLASQAGRQAAINLRAALEQPERAQKMRDAGYTRRPTLREMAEQEPVAWRFQSPLSEEGQWEYGKEPPVGSRWAIEPLYTHPPRREWRGLKEWEINDGLDQLPTEDVCSWSFRKGVYFAEAALKERNA